jgi:tRNA-modifying protein YgfZ
MRFVMEVGHALRAVSYSKGCFPGQEPIVMARDRAGRVNRSFTGLKLSAQVEPGAKLMAAGQEVGLLTSVTHSPRLQSWLGMGYVHWKQVEPGTTLESDNGVTAVVLGYPPITPGSP